MADTVKCKYPGCEHTTSLTASGTAARAGWLTKTYSIPWKHQWDHYCPDHIPAPTPPAKPGGQHG